VRLDDKTKKQFQELCRREGKTSSEVVRRLVKEYIKERDMSLYIDDLWGRISNRFKSQNINLSTIERMIFEVREENK